jgi:L-fuculose-phosphate aldolase
MTQPPVTPPPETIELRWEVIRTCFSMRDQLGYFMGTWGSISVRVEGGFLVTPSRMKLEEIKPEDLVVVDWEGSVIGGHRQPTIDAELHRQVLLHRPDLGALIHSHSPWASVCACSHRSIPVFTDDMAAVIGGEVRTTRYVPAGQDRELAQAARDAIGPDASAVLLANHGVVAGGRDLAEAVVAAQIVERGAMIFIQSEALGGATPIAEQHWRGQRARYLEAPPKPEPASPPPSRPFPAIQRATLEPPA